MTQQRPSDQETDANDVRAAGEVTCDLMPATPPTKERPMTEPADPIREDNVKDVRSLRDVSLDRLNANRGTTRGRETLAHSLRAYGTGRAIVVDRQGRVIAGNKTVEQAQALALPVQVVHSDGATLIVVQRVDLDLARDPRARQLAVADNRTSELGLEWDPDLLRQHVAEGLDLRDLWFDQELEKLLGTGALVSTPGQDTAVAPRATDITRGDLFQLGGHRLLCGDATSPADVERVLDGECPRLMATDPPYGVEYDPAWRQPLQPGARTAVGRVTHDDRVDWSEAYRLFPGEVAYVWHAGRFAGAVAASLEASRFAIRAQIIWVKQHFVLSRGDYHWMHEPCWYAVRSGGNAHWQGDRTQTTVWSVPNLNSHGGDRSDENTVTGHGTQKPVRLFEIPIANHTLRGEAIYEPFAGSGTALIAAEKARRRCLALEIEPCYVQAILDRWEAFTGHRAVKVG